MTGPPGSPSSTIMVVEDQEQLRLMMTRILTDAGFEVLQASDGQAALELFSNRTNIQLVVTDIIMPRMDGLELATALATASSPVPVLFTSGYGQHYTELPGPILRKPFKSEALVAEVRRLLAPPH
jgi:CheY-like chemotaxis protein